MVENYLDSVGDSTEQRDAKDVPTKVEDVKPSNPNPRPGRNHSTTSPDPDPDPDPDPYHWP